MERKNDYEIRSNKFIKVGRKTNDLKVAVLQLEKILIILRYKNKYTLRVQKRVISIYTYTHVRAFIRLCAVSYTHLDVYKRQIMNESNRKSYKVQYKYRSNCKM